MVQTYCVVQVKWLVQLADDDLKNTTKFFRRAFALPMNYCGNQDVAAALEKLEVV